MFDLEHRKAQLEAIWEEQGWRGIAAIAKPLNIEKPEDGWDEAIPLIVEAEYKIESEKHNALIDSLEEGSILPAIEDKPSLEVETKELEKSPYIPKGVYATEYFKKHNIPYCETCGAQYQNENGAPVCAENYEHCPRLKKEST